MGASRKPGQQVKSVRPYQGGPVVKERYSLTFPTPFTHAVDLFLFSRHTGDCWTSSLRAAKIAAKIKHAWLLEACLSTQLACPLLSTTALAASHPGEARTFSERPCSFCCQIGPANGIAECRVQVGRTPCLHRGQSLHQWSVTWCRLCTRRREHTARPGTLQTRQP